LSWPAAAEHLAIGGEVAADHLVGAGPEAPVSTKEKPGGTQGPGQHGYTEGQHQYREGSTRTDGTFRVPSRRKNSYRISLARRLSYFQKRLEGREEQHKA